MGKSGSRRARPKALSLGDEFLPKENTSATFGKEVPRQEYGRGRALMDRSGEKFSGQRLRVTQLLCSVWEWTSDWFHPTWRQTADAKNPTGPQEGTSNQRRLFSVSRFLLQPLPGGCPDEKHPDSSTSHTGFRLACRED